MRKMQGNGNKKPNSPFPKDPLVTIVEVATGGQQCHTNNLAQKLVNSGEWQLAPGYADRTALQT